MKKKRSVYNLKYIQKNRYDPHFSSFYKKKNIQSAYYTFYIFYMKKSIWSNIVYIYVEESSR